MHHHRQQNNDAKASKRSIKTMVKFTIQFFLAAVILFFGVLLGMQQANEGLMKMKGYNDPSFQQVIHLSADEQGEIEASIMGNAVNSSNLEEKKRKLEEMKAFNIFTELGKRFGEGIRAIVEQIIHALTHLLNG